jgi:cyclopropane fatty-acyl-phospholipid synthase-like methyltransferase
MRACPVCGLENPVVATKLERKEYTECRDCGLFYVHRDVSVEDFSHGYYDDGCRLLGRDKYHDDFFDNDSMREASKHFVNAIASAIGFPSWQDKNVLEIGSACGYVVSALADCGANALGIEVSRFASEYALEKEHKQRPNANTICANWEVFDISGYENRFDVIIALHVIEHFVYPMEAFQRIHEALKTGGVFICQNPDSDSNTAKHHVQEHIPDEHLQIFNKQSFNYILSQFGFRVISYELYHDHGMSHHHLIKE